MSVCSFPVFLFIISRHTLYNEKQNDRYHKENDRYNRRNMAEWNKAKQNKSSCNDKDADPCKYCPQESYLRAYF